MKQIGVTPPVSRRIIPCSLAPVEECVACWQNMHPRKPYPAAWSSTLCDYHAQWTRNERKNHAH